MCPFPCRRRLCPGRTDKKESSSGAPKNMDGMKSMNVCVIDIETMKIIIGRVGIGVNKGKVRRERSIAEIRFMCIPGKRPVNVPARMPRRIANADRRKIESI